MRTASDLPLPIVRLHHAMGPHQLDGEVDVSATLGSGQVVMTRGLLARGASVLVLPMAERAGAYLSARLAQALDADTGHLLLALDEGADDDTPLPPALADRCAFRVTLKDIPQLAESPCLLTCQRSL